MDILVIANGIVLTVLVFFYVWEERRHRSLRKKVADTKADLTVIIHQLRSPLSDLRKYHEFLQNKEFGTLSFSQQEAINKAQSALSESILLFDRLIARSRLDEGTVASEQMPLGMREIVQGVVDSVMPIVREKKHELVLKVNGNIRVSCDSLLLHGILDEIISNAVHYTPDGGKISIAVSEKGKFVIVEVRDSGIGISEEELPHIFDKYFRGETARTMFAGNGLGLAFSRQFARMFGGTLVCQSSLKKGTVFTLSLPRAS